MILAFVAGVLPLWLSSTEMWDGVIGIHALATGDWATLRAWLLDSNWYLTYAVFLLADTVHQIARIPWWIFFKLWITLLVLGIAYEVYRLAIDVFEIPAFTAKWLPALIFSFPIWYVFFSYTPMLGHLTCVWLALVGYRLIYSNKQGMRLRGFFIVAMAFQLASNCAFLLALEAGRWLMRIDKTNWSYWRSVSLLLLAIGVFSATRVVWPPVSTYIGYNRFLNPLALTSWVSYAKHMILFGTWFVLLVPMVIAFWVTQGRQDYLLQKLQPGLGQGWKIWALWGLLMLSACLPYIAVGLGSPLFVINLHTSDSVSAVLASASAEEPITVWYGGWGARHMLLMLIPFALFAAWLASKCQRVVAPDSTGLLATLGGAFVAMVSINLLFGIPGHWAKLDRIAKEKSVVLSLASEPVLPYGEVDLLLDKHVDYLGYMYETNYLLLQAYGASSWSALMLPDYPAVKYWGKTEREFVLEQSRKDRSMVAKLNLMDDYSWNITCKTVAKVKLPELGVWDVLWRAEHSPEQLPKAQVTPVSSNCPQADGFWRSP